MNLSETTESSCYNSNPNIKYESCTWTRETCLQNFTKKKLQTNFPNGLSEHGELILVGKTRSKLSSSNRITDQIGQARKSMGKLEICHMGKVYQLDSFVLLNFTRPEHFHWVSSDSFPDHALRAGYDTVNQNVLYIARANATKSSCLIGKVNSNELRLITSTKQDIKLFDKYQVLCLRPSSQTLKILCRNRLRQILKQNLNIEKLKLKDSKLLSFIKFKPHLNPGESLKRTECIQSPNGKYRLSLDDKGNLKFFINQSDYIFIYENVESLWFNDLKLVVCFNDLKSLNFLANFSSVNAIYSGYSKLKLCNKGFLSLISDADEFKIMIQFRHDLDSYVNTVKPKYDFSYFYVKNEKYSSSDTSDDENESDETSDDSSGTDSDTTSDTD